MTQLLLVRHGETFWNLERRIQGQTNSELSPAGLAQAEALAIRLRDDPARLLVASDLVRTMRTAAPLALCTGLAIEPHAGLRERSFGVFEGHTVAEIERKYPREYAGWKSRDPEYVIPGAETLVQLRHRVKAVLEAIARRGVSRVIVVTHGGVLDVAYRIALGIADDAPRAWPLHNASINQIEVTDDHWSLGPWGDVAHLADVGDEIA